MTVIAILAVLVALIVPAINTTRERAAPTDTVSRMKSIGQLLLLYAAENNGDLRALYSPTRRWPNLVAPVAGWADPTAPHADQYQQVHRLKDIRPAQFDDLTAKMKSGQVPVSNVGVFGLNNFFAGRNTAQTSWRVIHVKKPSDTPLLAPVSRNTGTHFEALGAAPEATAMGFEGTTHPTGPLPVKNGTMIYVMFDGSIQQRGDFWPFRETEPWRYFHPLREEATSASQAAPGF